MLCAFFWVIPRRLNFICWRFGTPVCSIFTYNSLSEWLGLFSSQTFSRINTPIFSTQSVFIPTRLWRWNRVCSETLSYKISRCRLITQKKTYNNIPILIFSPLESWGRFLARISVHGLGITKELFAKHMIFFTTSMHLVWYEDSYIRYVYRFQWNYKIPYLQGW